MANKYTNLAQAADKSFDGKYSKELAELIGLSEEELASVIPITENKETLTALINVVTQASQENLAQADLMDNIKKLGDVAINIAKKIPGLKNLFDD